MLRRIEPEKIICYNTPFPEMQGDIVYVDYERSSWKYMSYERVSPTADLEAFKIGSAYGGDWKPNLNKPNDQNFIGTPGEINQTFDEHG